MEIAGNTIGAGTGVGMGVGTVTLTGTVTEAGLQKFSRKPVSRTVTVKVSVPPVAISSAPAV